MAGEAAIYFDPDSLESMETAICRVLENPVRRREMVSRGREQVRKFRAGNFARALAARVEAAARPDPEAAR